MDFRILSIMSNSVIYIETNYFTHSTSIGVLYAFLFIHERLIDFSKSVYLPLNRTESLNFMLFNVLSPGQYKVFAYDIESDGTLKEGENYPAFASDVTVFDENNQFQG